MLSGTIASIEYVGAQHVYDVEMAEPAHNFVVESGIVTSNSHAVCVALDSLYGAYAKAHYPLEYYTTLLSNYASKSDKDRIALVKEEMKHGFGIRVVPCKFRQDNRDFYLDRVANTIADALTSVKHVSQRVADALYDMRDNTYVSFIDLLYDMEMHPAFDLTNTTILIRMGYFEEFGSAGKLLKVLDAFRNGQYRFSKNHVPVTQAARLRFLRQIAADMTDDAISMLEQVRFEVTHYGTVLSTFPNQRAHYAVLDVDAKYSPKLRLYNLAGGTIGMVKMKKALYQDDPLVPGDVIHLLDWERRPAYEYVGGKSRPKAGVQELWIRRFTKTS